LLGGRDEARVHANVTDQLKARGSQFGQVGSDAARQVQEQNGVRLAQHHKTPGREPQALFVVDDLVLGFRH
jgi:hypothetical protein